MVETPIHLAVVSGHLEKYQMENMNSENSYGEPPLHSAVISGHLKNSKPQMENMNTENNYGEPPLHLVAVRTKLMLPC